MDQFCPDCGVDLGLHDVSDPDEVTPADCASADRKANLLDAFWRPFMRAV